MKNKNIDIQGEKISLRLIKNSDISEYYQSGFASPDEEVQLYTGTMKKPTEDEIRTYVEKITEDDSRYDFLIINSKGKIIGESVINEIDEELRCAHFRIALFKSEDCGRGMGSEAIQMTLQFGFEKLNLHRIEPEVFSFNQRAYQAYLRAGFVEEGRKRDAVLIKGQYHDVIIMGILQHEFISRGASMK
jgi:RimJ/RimL family protein N-acetyltransferase